MPTRTHSVLFVVKKHALTSISAALVVVVIDTLIAPIHCFDYDYDNDWECDPTIDT